MRKERNNFFSEYNNGYYYSNSFPSPQMNQVEAYNQFYMNQNMNNDPSSYNDYQTRLARLERQVNRLESRVTKLENSPINNISDTTNIDSNSNMYMI